MVTKNRIAKKTRKNDKPRCLSVANAGINTASQFAGFMSALMSDLIEGNISPQVGNAAVNAGGKLLKVVEMQYQYGRKSDGTSSDFSLTGPASPSV